MRLPFLPRDLFGQPNQHTPPGSTEIRFTITVWNENPRFGSLDFEFTPPEGSVETD